jgi:hypothetical protein
MRDSSNNPMKTLLLPSQIGNATHARVTVQDGTEPQRTAGFVYVLGYYVERPTPEAILTEEGITVQPADPAPIFTPTEGERWTYCPGAGEIADKAIAAYIVANPSRPAPSIQQPPTVCEYTAGIQAWLDSEAAKLGYDNALSLCTYADSTVPKFYEEARQGIRRRDFAWSRGYEMLATPPDVLPSVAELVDQIAKEFESQ